MAEAPDPPIIIMKHGIKNHVNFGHIAQVEGSEKLEWKISGAHNSHNFFIKAAKFASDYPGTLVQLCEFVNLFHCQARENAAFQLKYRLESGDKLKVKSLYNPRSFSEGQLFRLAKMAFANWRMDEYSPASANHWFGSAEEKGQIFQFAGLYEFIGENTYKVNTYYLKGISCTNQ